MLKHGTRGSRLLVPMTFTRIRAACIRVLAPKARWEEEKQDDGVKWHKLHHKGPYFAPPYEPLPSSVKFYYNGRPMKLSRAAEEVATFFAKMLDHDYARKKVFRDNFFCDWMQVMTPQERKKIKDLKRCDFSDIHHYFLEKQEAQKALPKEEKQVQT
uniref:DNA topoisomerase I DNA binding eukaryotic-type domain-containing protein n=1 Tax=Pseudonaja textilis TaxID=8673 RepID=A0A670ZVY1_PSETE